jgi:hypothetical protein
MNEREEELKRIIREKVNACDENKWMRVKRTFLVLSGVVYLLEIYNGLQSDKIDIDIEYLLTWLLASPIVAGFVFIISYGILHYMIAGALEEEKTIARLIGRLEGIEEVKRSEKD